MKRDRLLAYASAGYLVATLLVWLLLFLVGYALMLWPSSLDLGDAFRTAGSSMLTLGIAAPHGSVSTVVVYLAALTGLVVVALQIAYLPVLFAAYNRRETLVTMLEGLAGTPGWGPEVLVRSAVVDNLDGLGIMYDRWMQWAADVSESHTAYMVLLYFRSPNAAVLGSSRSSPSSTRPRCSWRCARSRCPRPRATSCASATSPSGSSLPPSVSPSTMTPALMTVSS